MKNNNRLQRGFTLIELMVTVAIIAIAMSLVIPSLTTFQRNAELTATANTLLSSINTARSEAMKRGMNAMVVPNDNTNWGLGWIVFVDVDRSGNPTASANIQIAIQEAMPSYLSLTSLPNPISFKFDASGFATSSNGSIEIKRNDVPASEVLVQTRKVIVAPTGRVRVCKPASASDPDC